jgi:Protein of unknown function (DUF2569)
MADTFSSPSRAAPNGIWGWLIFPAIGTFLSPVLLAVSLLKMAPDFEKIWHGRNALSPGLLAFIGIESFLNIAFIGGWVAAIYFLVTKSSRYPRAYIFLMLGMLVFLISDALITLLGFGASPSSSDIQSIVRLAIASAIWCPYMARSKRVKNTFVN